MGRRKRRRGSISAYFREVFQKHPEWLKGKSNQAVLSQYRTDHSIGTDAEIPKNIRNNLANLKSILRKKSRGRTGTSSIKVSATASATKLEALEELIDECLTQAKTLDREGLHNVIRNLRSARNEVVWKMGQ
jgi:uncharacterized protein (UPF0147 family)